MAVPGYVLKNRRTTLERCQKFIGDNLFNDTNLFGRLYPSKAPVTTITHYAAPGRISYAEAVQGEYFPANVGDQFGPTWSTHWFRITVDIPSAWVGQRILFMWESGSEAMLWMNGDPVQGFNADHTRNSYTLTKNKSESENKLTVYVEMSCSGLFGAGNGLITPPVANKKYTLSRVEIVTCSEASQELLLDFEILTDFAKFSANIYQFYVEMACNGLFGAGSPDMISPPDLNRQFTLSKCEIATIDMDCYQLYTDFSVLDDYVEMAANELFGAGINNEQIASPELDRKFTLSRVELCTMDVKAKELSLDFQIMSDFIQTLGDNSNRGYKALYTADKMVNMTNPFDSSTFEAAHDLAASFFSEQNGAGQHTVYAVGNCHIDTAWLWPYAETVRKCARSFSSTIKLIEEYPEFIFACSQAQQFEWVKENYPSIFTDMKTYSDLGRFVPVGGTWVEMDGNVPSGEAFIRQFLLGQRFFQSNFGVRCKVFWLPDTFGYSAQIPQIMSLFNMKWFMTQKLSWNLVNKFPHNTFHWSGIDGTRALAHFPPGDSYVMQGYPREHHTFWWGGLDGTDVLVHFPPADSYGLEATVEEVVRTLDNFKDKGRSNHSLFLYGYGDGGQGPTASMIERLKRMEDIDGIPKVQFGTPDDFFNQVEENESDNLCEWKGELYLELHNATYTTQAKIKLGNRKGEILLHDVELFGALAVSLDPAAMKKSKRQKLVYDYPTTELLRLWKLLLLNQFHDVLPGSCINEVASDAEAYYNDIQTSGGVLLTDAVQGVFDTMGNSANKIPKSMVTNTMSWSRRELISVPDAGLLDPEAVKKLQKDPRTQMSKIGNTLTLVDVPSCGYNLMTPIETPNNPVTITTGVEGNITIGNGLVQAIVDPVGRLMSLTVPGQSKDAISPGSLGNQFALFNDVPLYWDAWDVMDYHLETYQALDEVIQAARITDNGPLRCTVEVTVKISDNSYLTQEIILDADCPFIKFVTQVEWHESHKFLKVEFPVNVLSQQATYEIQFGHLQRPTNFNTSWDWAKYEVCGHKWADLSEYNWGLSILNDSKYGWSCIGNVLRLSLLRAPKNPDASADIGTQTFTYAAMPHTGTFQSAGTIQAAYNLNNPLKLSSIMISDDHQVDTTSYIQVDTPAVVLETLKKAEDSENLVVRLYEAFGSHTQATVTFNLPVTQVHLVNGFEEIDTENTLTVVDGAVTLQFNPFQIVSLMLVP